MWLPLRRRINRLRNVAGFIALWDAEPERRKDLRYRLRHSTFGNINRTGRAGELSAPALPYWHTQFVSSIEVGVRPLVLALVGTGRWISYTSCAGHDYGELGLPCVERHVGLLPRDPAEYVDLAAMLGKAIVAVARAQEGVTAYPGLVAGTLVDGDRTWPVIDLYIARGDSADWTMYFAELDSVTLQLARALEIEIRTAAG